MIGKEEMRFWLEHPRGEEGVELLWKQVLHRERAKIDDGNFELCTWRKIKAKMSKKKFCLG